MLGRMSCVICGLWFPKKSACSPFFPFHLPAAWGMVTRAAEDESNLLSGGTHPPGPPMSLEQSHLLAMRQPHTPPAWGRKACLMEPCAFWDSMLHQVGLAFPYSFGNKRMGKSRDRAAVLCEVKKCPLQSGEGVLERLFGSWNVGRGDGRYPFSTSRV